ncbi:hypothetical protein GCM10027436_20420 [Actinophytocola sediminis]
MSVRVLSIDLGTSNTVAVLAANGWPPRVVDVDGASTMPSAVFAAEDGRLVVGREALRLARTAPARLAPNPRRRVDEGTLSLGDVVVPVAAALGAVLGKIVREVSRQLGGVLPDQVRLTHPASWDAARRAVLLDAARQAGITTAVALVPEPVAAAAHVASVTGRVLAPGQALAVCDLGAGTFDVAVVGAGQQGLTVLAESGLADLGGLDIDQALLDHLGRQVAERDPEAWRRLVTPLSAEDRRVALVLREDIRVAKEALSEHPRTEVVMPEPFGSAPVTRDELETLIRPGLRHGVESLGTTTRGAGMDVGWLAGVYLVGGSSRIPLVATMIAEQLPVVPTALGQPETAVAFGAHQVDLNGLGPQTRPLGQLLPYAPARRARRSRVGVVVGVLSVVLVAALVAAIVLVNRPTTTTASPPPGPNGKGGFHWSLTNEEAGYYTGMWAAPDSVVFGSWDGLAAYDPESGRELWSWEVPDGNFLCGMSPTVTASGLGAFTYGKGDSGGDDCTILQTISVESGELNWDDPVSLVAAGYSGWLGEIGGTSLSISDDLVTAAYAGDKSQAANSTDLTWVDTRTGERIGSTDLGAEPLLDQCTLSGYAQAQTTNVIAVANCATYGARTVVWSKEDAKWRQGTGLEGCGEVANSVDTAFMRSTGTDTLLLGCFASATLGRLYTLPNAWHADPVSLDGVALESVATGGGAGNPPKNLLLDDRMLYFARGERTTSNGVLASSDGHRRWEHALRDTTEVSLLAVDDDAVTVLVVEPGPSTLYTVAGANEVVRAPELDSRVAEKLPGAKRAVRVGDYLVCAFAALEADGTVIGAVRMVE